MINGKNQENQTIINTEKPIENMPAPEIFNLINSAASVDQIASRIFQDFYSPEQDKEKVFLGIMDLVERNLEGISALNFISRDSGKLGEIATQVLNYVLKEPNASLEAKRIFLDNLLGLNRMPVMFNNNKVKLKDEFYQAVWRQAVKRGYWQGSFNDFIKHEENYFFNSLELSAQTNQTAHETGVLEGEIATRHSTFGIAEPTYLEMICSREILRLRSLNRPNFLLVGSQGKYSAEEFADFSKKINNSAISHVVDVNPKMLKHYQKVKDKKDLYFVLGSGLQMPYRLDSMNLVCTNDLLHHLATKDREKDPRDQNIIQLLKEIHKILKPGGILLMSEQPFARHAGHFEQKKQGLFTGNYGILREEMEKHIRRLALQTEFSKISFNKYDYSFALRPEVSQSIIDSNGFPHYGDNLIIKRADIDLKACLVK